MSNAIQTIMAVLNDSENECSTDPPRQVLFGNLNWMLWDLLNCITKIL